MTPPRNYSEVLSTLAPGSEVNVYTAKKAYYNAKFLKFYPQMNVATFVIDQFYECGGSQITIQCNRIKSMDLPLSLRDGSDEDE
jgi:hypothetical protein